MSDRLDPEVKAMRVAVRAMATLDVAEQRRVVAFLAARYGGANGHTANEARMRECLRWVYSDFQTSTKTRDLLAQVLRDTK